MTSASTITPLVLRNKELEICFEAEGGIISSVRHVSSPVNPLSFRMARDAGSDEYFSGHFICTPRWGDASNGERKSGAIKHGELCHLNWVIAEQAGQFIQASAVSRTDDIKVERRMLLAAHAPVCTVRETITNTGKVFRPCNLVQHPTIAAPFLHEHTRVDCNGVRGVRDAGVGNKPVTTGKWPSSSNRQGNEVELNYASPENAGVYSFDVADTVTGWITALDPRSGLLLGYCWDARLFPWIYHWIHVENEKPLYRGLEFGTAALHQPFAVIAENNWWLFNNKPSCFFLDAGASKTFSYHFFLIPVPAGFEKVKDVLLEEGKISVTGNSGKMEMIL